MKKALAWLLVIAMTAALAVGGTLAYLTDTDDDVNVMTVGQVKIDQLEYERVNVDSKDEDATVQEFHDNKPLYPAVTEDGFVYTPGDTYVDWDQIGKDGYTSEIWDPSKINNEQDKMVFVKNKGDWDAYVRTVFGFEANGYTLAQFKELFHLNLNETDWTWEWTESVDINGTNYIIATATYNKVLAPGALTEISLSQIALDSKATNADIESFGDTYQILVQSQAVQADGFEDPATALNEAFGEIVVSDEKIEIPFENDEPVKGIGLKTALRYINGTKDSGLDSRNVTKNVIIDDASKYPEITAKYKGVLVDVLQDVPAYAYYVPNGNLYDIYVLSSDKVYADNCYMLFYKWAELESVYCPAMDTSRVTDARFSYMFTNASKLQSVYPTNWDTSMANTMYAMFGECGKLTTLDVSTWDTSNVTDTRVMFLRCVSLETLPGSGNLDFGQVTSMNCMFEGCNALTYLDATNWDCGNCTDMGSMFGWAHNLTALEGSENWDVSKVQTMVQMFGYAYKLSDLDVSTWKPSSCTDMSFMFKGCRGLTALDVENWDVSNVKVFNSMFSGDGHNTGDMNLTSLNLTKWDMGNAEKINHMFYGCGVLKEVDMSGWDVRNVHDMNHMFSDCFDLERVDFTGWQTDSLSNMDCMFNNCESLKSVDMSMFDTSEVTYMCQMFEACYSLEEVIGLENWDTGNVTDFSEMFTGTKLTELNLSSFDTSSAKIVYTMFSNNQLLKTIYVGDGWDMSGVTSSYSMFSGCTALVGGAGTSYTASVTDHTYAVVDGGVDAPGYLTHINDKP